MPSADAVLLPLCVALALVGLVVVAVSWRRRSPGRVLQGLALALAPLALYFSGLLPLLWRAVVAVVQWGTTVVLSPIVWLGFGLLAVCVVLWVVGGLVARRTPRRKVDQASNRPAVPATQDARRGGRQAVPAQRQQQAPVDDDMAEIEALLKKRGIE